MFVQGHTSPSKGKTITTDPIKSSADLAKVKAVTQKSPRDHALLMLMIHTALRAGDICRLTWDDIYDTEVRLIERKTGKRKVVPLNEPTMEALRVWRGRCEHEQIASGQRGALTTATLGRLVKGWCEEAGLVGRFSSHSTRKGFVRIHVDEVGTSMAALMTIGNWSSERMVLHYCGKLDDSVRVAYSVAL